MSNGNVVARLCWILAVCSASPALAGIGAVGSEFIVNVYTTGYQVDAVIAAVPGGGFVVTWHGDAEYGGTNTNVFTRALDSLGVPVGSEFQVNTTAGDQGNTTIAPEVGGGFAVVWQGTNSSNDDNGVFARKVDSAGVPQGSEFQVSADTSDEGDAVVVSDPNGGFLVVWERLGIDGDEDGVVARRLDSSAMPVGSEFVVNSYTLGDQGDPGVAADPGGAGFLVVWESEGVDGEGDGIAARRLDSIGQPIGSEFLVNSYTTGNQAIPADSDFFIAADSSGDFVVVWGSQGQDGSDWGVFLRRVDSSGAPVGSEFQVNTYTTDGQNNPAILALPGGEFVVLWEGNSQDGDGYGIFGRSLDSSGLPTGPEFQVNAHTTGDQSNPELVVGSQIVVWESQDQDGDGTAIVTRTLAESKFNAVGSEFIVNVYTPGGQVDGVIAAVPGGGFVVTWHGDADNGGINTNVFTRALDSLGVPVGSEFQVNTTAGDQGNTTIAPEIGGGFAVVWQGTNSSNDDNGVFARKVDSAGVPQGSEFQVSTDTIDEGDAVVVSDPNGGFLVVWERSDIDGDQDGVVARRLDSSAMPVGSEFVVNAYTIGDQSDPGVAADSGGTGFLVVWESEDVDGDGDGIVARRLDSIGQPTGSEFVVNSYTTGNQGIQADSDFFIAADSSGGFVVVWDSRYRDGSDWGVFVRRVDSSGAPVGSEFQVNTYTMDVQKNAAIAAVPGGEFVVLWESYGQDGDEYGIFGRSLDSSGVPTGPEFQVNAHTTGNQANPELAVGSLVVVWESPQDGDRSAIIARSLASAPVATASPTSTPTDTPTLTPTTTPTDTPTLTPTITPTDTPTLTPTVTPTSTATNTPAPDGALCGDSSQCTSGNCADGVCCNEACTGVNVSCNLPGSAGTCAELPAAVAPTVSWYGMWAVLAVLLGCGFVGFSRLQRRSRRVV